MIIEWQTGAYTQYRNYYGLGAVLNWLSSLPIGRFLSLRTITSQHRNPVILISQNKNVEGVTGQDRDLKILTAQDKDIKPTTSQNKRVNPLTTGG